MNKKQDENLHPAGKKAEATPEKRPQQQERETLRENEESEEVMAEVNETPEGEPQEHQD